MKYTPTVLISVLAFAGLSAMVMAAPPATGSAGHAGDAALRETLTNLEKQSWVAWKGHDAKYFQNFLSDDHLDVRPNGTASKASVVAGVGSPVCTVESYTVDNFQVTPIANDVALLTYHAEQKTTCGGAAVPSPAWVTSVYVRRGGRWLNALFQQSAASGK